MVTVESLIGPRIELRPLQATDAGALVAAAADGELWNLSFTVVPSAETIDETIREIRRFRKTHSLDGLSMKEMIEEGRR